MLFNLALRIYTLRVLLIGSIALIPTLVIALLDGKPLVSYLWLGLACEILVHQFVSIYIWSYFYEIFDFLLLSFELISWFLLGFQNLHINRYSVQNDVILTTNLYVVITSLSVLCLLRFAVIAKSRGRRLFKPFDVFAVVSICDGSGAGAGGRIIGEVEDRVVKPSRRKSAFLGRAMWKSPFRGETQFIKLLRGLLSLGFLGAILAFAMVAVILEPIKEMGLVPSKTYHATDVVYDFNMALPVWSIVAFVDMRLDVANDVERFKKAVSVIPLWDDSDPYKPDCVHLEGNKTFGGQVKNVQSDPYIQTITIFCPSRKVKMDPQSIMTSPSSITSPDLIIAINFTLLGITPPPPTSDPLSNLAPLIDARMSTIGILVGLTNNTEDVVVNTIPTPIFPGHRLCASVSREFRRRFVKPQEASWGIFSPSRAFLITNLFTILPDPFAPLIISSLGLGDSTNSDTATTTPTPTAPELSTLRIFGQNDNSDWSITQDYRQNSVWSGLAEVGGFFTFLSGVFVCFFGVGLMRVLFGIKPLSIFGLVHIFDRDSLRKAWRQDYAGLIEEAKAPKSKKGLVALLRDHLVDVEMLLGVDYDIEANAGRDTDDNVGDDKTGGDRDREKTRARGHHDLGHAWGFEKDKDNPAGGVKLNVMPLGEEEDDVNLKVYELV